MLVLCDKDLVATGTAFVVSKRSVLTAYHNVGSTKKHYAASWFLVNGLERSNTGDVTTTDGVTVPVKIVAYCRKSDWVLLSRTDLLEFDAGDVVPICASENVPSRVDEPTIKIYHCPVGLFNSEEIDAVMSVTVATKISMLTGHSLFFQIGLFAGSSGALVTLTDGSAIGMHIEGINSAISLASVHAAHEAAGDDSASSEDCLAEVSDSCVQCYGAFSRAILLPRFSNLISEVAKH